jgi:hypothetical protein
MKCLHRNKSKFHYALFLEKVAIKDEYGNASGEVRIVYSEPIEANANVSAANGEAQVEQFGNSVLYDKVIITDELNIPIDENSVLCIDSPPSYDENGNLLYDYIVKKIARSLNTVSFAVSKVSVS